MKRAEKHLMIIDDEVAMRALLRDFLQSLGYRVAAYASAQDALKAIEAGHNPVAIVSDIRMPRMDGVTFLKEIKRGYPTMPVILYTGQGNPAEKNHALALGASQYLAKPFSLLTLKGLLEEAGSKESKK